MSKISTYLAIALVIIFFVIGVGTGYYFTPAYSLSMYDKSSMDLGRADKWLDLRYIDGMIAHHRGAMLLAAQAENSSRVEVQNLAKDIKESEPKAIEELYTWKKNWYGDTKKVADPVVSNLGNYNDTFDLRFLNALISHHAIGIEMTKDVRIKSSRNEILDNADAVEKFLKESADMLKGWRLAWYNI